MNQILQQMRTRNAKILPIFHFDRVNNGRIYHILCVNNSLKTGQNITKTYIVQRLLMLLARVVVVPMVRLVRLVWWRHLMMVLVRRVVMVLTST